MRIFRNPLEMVKEVERDLFEMGITVASHTMQDKIVEGNKDFHTKELFGYAYTLSAFDDEGLYEAIEYLKGNKRWAQREFMDRVADRHLNPGGAYKLWEELWKPFLRRDNRFSYTYNERMRDQISQVIFELRERPNTRQAVMTIYDKHLDLANWGGFDRVCCSMHYQFYLREGKLNSIYCMRSCDFLTHFIHDVFFACQLQLYIANSIGADSGIFTHFLGSLHAYNKDLQARGVF